MVEKFFADLHTHPTFKNFNRSRFKQDFFTEPYVYSLFTEGTVDDDARNKGEELGKRKSTYEQAAIIDCFPDRKQGEPVTKIIFASLYPLERGWVIGNAEGGIHETDIDRITKEKKNNIFKRFKNFVASSLMDVGLDNSAPLRSFLQKGYLGIPYERIRYFQGYKTLDADDISLNSHLMPADGYSYFGDLVDEYKFICRKDNTPWTVVTNTFQYKLLRTQSDLNIIINNPTVVGVPITIEGAHVFSVDLSSNGYAQTPLPEMFRRIDVLKTWKPFFLTLCHHFDNTICGHAHSMPLELAQFVDQRKKMNTILTDEGIMVLKKLLAINDSMQNISVEHRILIDVKHMSAIARKRFYKDIIKNYEAVNGGKTIPVICSHCAYSGSETLNQLIAKATEENYIVENREEILTVPFDTSTQSKTADFYNWNINLCNEDIEIITNSGGLIGITFDQRVLGHQHSNVTENPLYWSNVYVEQIIFMAKAWILGAGKNNPLRIYDVLTIGSDFDGIIDPMNDFGSIKRFRDFKINLINNLTALPQTIKTTLQIDTPVGKTSAEIADNLCFTNAFTFLKNNLPV